MFKGTTLKSFNKKFKSEMDCKQYLFDLKWKRKYQCRRCGHSKYWKGRTSFHTRCAKCKFDESETAHTIFHKIQIPLLKAFGMAFHISVLKKGISSTNLAIIFGVNQKSAWLFKRKVQDAMGVCDTDESTVISQRKVTRIDSVILMKRGKGLNRLQIIDVVMKKIKGRPKSPKVLCKVNILPDHSEPCELLNGHYVGNKKEILLWNMKQWITGTHHHCSEKFLQGYVDEFFFRHNRRNRLGRVWHELIEAMVTAKPYRAAKGVAHG